MSTPKSKRKSKNAKVPIVMQLEAVECGAACLSMILAYYGRWIPLEQLRIDCGVSRNGTNAKNMALTAEKYGLEIEAFSSEPGELEKNGQFPCIIHWEMNHFVVLEGFTKRHALITDPGKGRIKVTKEEFDRCFTGVVMYFTPGKNFKKEGRRKSIWPFALKKLRGTGISFSLVAFTTALISVFGLASPGFARFFTDYLLTSKALELFLPFIILFGIFTTFWIATLIFQAIYTLKVNGQIALSSSYSFMWHLLCLPIEFYTQRIAGDIIARKDENTNVVNILVNTLAPLVIDSFMLVFYLVVLIRYSPALSLIGVGSVLINLLITNFISKKQADLARVNVRDTARQISSGLTAISSIESIKASGSENGFFER